MTVTMTIACTCCSHQFGAWRPRCPACGTAVPPAKREALLNAPRFVEADAPARVRRSRKNRPPKRPCALCRLNVKKLRCPTCNQPVHKNCLPLHSTLCRPNPLEQPAALAAAITDRVRA